MIHHHFRLRLVTFARRLEDAVRARDHEKAAEALEDLGLLVSFMDNVLRTGGVAVLERKLGERVEEA